MENIDYSLWELHGMPNSYFKINRDRYIKNLKLRMKSLSPDGVVILKGGKEIPRYDTDVNHYHFFQESNFFYLTGVREPGFWATLDVNTGMLDLFYEKLPEDYKVWMKILSKEEISIKYEIPEDNIHTSEELNSFVSTRNPKTIYLMEGTNEYTKSPVLTADVNFEKEFSHLNERIIHDVMIYEILCDTRAVKSKEEFGLLRFISDITMDAHREIMKNIRPGIYERDLENVFNNYLASKYYTRIWAYPCIGGCGVNSATLHYDKNDVLINDGDIFLADMGIRFCNYTSDVTQTIPANGKFTTKQKQIYDIVLKSNRAVIAMMKPGVTKYPDMDKLSKMVILEELQKIGLIKESFSVDELYTAGIHKLFMPHGLGHFVGLDVHDVGSRVSYKSERILEEGNYITVEPGIYFIEFVLEKAFKDSEKNKYLNEDVIRGYLKLGGVRIEDDVFVTADGVINLNESLPRTTDEIEDFMKKK